LLSIIAFPPFLYYPISFAKIPVFVKLSAYHDFGYLTIYNIPQKPHLCYYMRIHFASCKSHPANGKRPKG
jgi:hypothetical protein